MFKKYTPDHFDKHGYLKPPIGFYLLLLLLLRAYIIWIVSLANRNDATVLIKAMYPDKMNFFIGLGVGIASVLVLAIFSQRREKFAPWLPKLWCHGKWLLWLSWLADTVVTLWFVKANHFKFVPEQAAVLLGLFFAALYLFNSSRLDDFFKDWPQENDTDADANKEKQQNSNV